MLWLTIIACMSMNRVHQGGGATRASSSHAPAGRRKPLLGEHMPLSVEVAKRGHER